jgi:phosphate transport system substrate-binding protein
VEEIKNMRIKKFYTMALLITLLAVFSITIPTSAMAGRTIIKIDGSSTVFPITEAVAEEFQMAHRGMMVTIGVSGTGGGFKKFCRGEMDVTNASRPIKPTELSQCKKGGVEFIELPVAYDGLAVMVHKGNDWVDYLTAKELKKIWQPKAQRNLLRWNQIRPNWPDKEIHLFAPGVDSGTFDYFTKAINGKEGASRGDFTASEDDNVLVQGISSDKGSLGFFGLAYYEYNKDKLKLIPIDDEKDSNGTGPILPSLATVNNGTYQPLSRPIFIYVNKAKLNSRADLESFIRFYLDNAAALAEEVGYIALPEKIHTLAVERFKKRITGSVFHGTKVGVKVEDLMKLK